MRRIEETDSTLVYVRVQFSCHRYRKYRDDMVAQEQRKSASATSRPITNAETCKFNFCVYYHKINQRWFFPKEGGGSLLHSGHAATPAALSQTSTRNVSKEDMELIVLSLEKNIPTAAIKELIRSKSGTNLSQEQLKNIRRTTVIGKDMVNLSPAERLIHNLRSDPQMSFIMLTAQKEVGSGLIVIKKTTKRKSQIEFDKYLSELYQGDVQDDTPDSYATLIMKALSINEDQEVLLCISWASAEQIRYFTMFPEVFGMDVTNKTNQEERPLHRGTVVSSAKKNIPVWNAFLPSLCKWCFNWLLCVALPSLFPAKALLNVVLILTDEDDQCKSQIRVARDKNVIRNAADRNCAWHKINRNFEIKVAKHCESDYDRTVLKIIVQWLYSICNKIETTVELEHSRRIFFLWLTTTGCSHQLITVTETFWMEKMKEVLDDMAHYKFMYTYGGWIMTSSFQESENSALKRDTMGPKPNQSIDRSQVTIAQHEGRRIEGLTQEHHQQMEKTTVSYDDPIFQELSRDVQPYIVSLLKREFDQRQHYSYIGCGPGKYYVRRHTWSDIEHHSFGEERFVVRVVPAYDRTRIVTITGKTVECSCGLFCRKGTPCRHIMAVLETPPEPCHVFHKHLKSYSTFYGINEDFTKRCDQLVLTKGPQVADLILSVNRLGTLLSWFEETLPGTSPVLRPGQVHEVEDYFVESNLEVVEDDVNTGMDGFGLAGFVSESKKSSYAASLETNLHDMPYPDNAYTVTHSKFQLLTKNVKTRGDFKILQDGMDKILTDLLGSKAHVSNGDAKMASLPVLTHKKKDSRLKPAGEIHMSKKKKIRPNT
jgi:hypothetical protein